jgi:hypothetical protein
MVSACEIPVSDSAISETASIMTAEDLSADALRLFFEILDRWDRELNERDKCQGCPTPYQGQPGQS